MDLNDLKAKIEAVLFAYGEPLTSAKLAELLEAEESLIERLMLLLRDDCEKKDRGIQLIRLENAWQFATKPQHAEVTKKALDTQRNLPLTDAALEVLAIIAYNQPVTRSFIDQVRGVDSSSTVNGLVEKNLLMEAGRMDLPGRPIAYKTTDAFLRAFGIQSLTELPPIYPENTPDDESGFYRQPDDEQPLAEDETAPPTEALSDGGFTEGEDGAAVVLNEQDDE